MEASTAEIAHTTSSKPIKEWGSDPVILDVLRPDGTNASILFSPYIRIQNHSLHLHKQQDGVEYDIPTDGDFNLILYANNNKDFLPIASVSIAMENDIPTLTMIQRVTARVKRDDVAPPLPDDLIQITAIYDRITHPAADLLQGENKIDWQRALLEQCELIAKKNGYQRLRLSSGFNSKYAAVGHNLNLAVQQYDYIVNEVENWRPIDFQGQFIVDQNARAELSAVIKQVRNKKIKTLEEIRAKYPNLPLPIAWEKDL